MSKNKYMSLFETLSEEEQRYIIEKAMEYQQLLNIDNSGDGWNDATDGFRHAWGSAYLSLKYNDLISHIATSGHELLESSYQPKEEKQMDEWNNKIGRQIAKQINNEYENIDENINWSSIEDLIALKTLEKINNNEIATSPLDSDDNVLKGQIEYNKPLSLKDRLFKAREEKLARYTQRLAESPEKIAEQEAKHVTLEELKAPQEARKKHVMDVINGTVEFDENADYSNYENKKSKNNQIFTKEDIEEMSDEERETNKEAIIYQEQTIGIPTRKQAQKVTQNGGMIHVSAYTRADGTKVRSYYRSR